MSGLYSYYLCAASMHDSTLALCALHPFAGVSAAFDAPATGALFAIEFVLKSSRLGLDRLSTSTVFAATSVSAGVVGFLRGQGQALGITGAATHLVGRIPYFSVNPNLLTDVLQVRSHVVVVWLLSACCLLGFSASVCTAGPAAVPGVSHAACCAFMHVCCCCRHCVLMCLPDQQSLLVCCCLSCSSLRWVLGVLVLLCCCTRAFV